MFVYKILQTEIDSVNHRFLLAKLKSSGIDGAVLNWIKPYPSNRSYQVQIDGVIFEESPCLSGLPEGSVIGPLLFRLYINDLPTALGDSAFLFADDVKMVFPRSQFSRLLFPLSPVPGQGNGTYQSTKHMCMSVFEPPSPFSVFLRGRH